MLIAVSALTSCRETQGDGAGYIFRANMTFNPLNLDPQLAEDASSKAVIINTFSGLVRFSESGVIEPHAAESYTISDDGLTYTFKLKENIFWMGQGEYTAPLTAYDFAFAFERILDENSYSPHSSVYACVKNAYATDDFTFVINLYYPYFKFIETLTHTAAMPCNRGFFNLTKGRYGLAADTALSCGAFYLKEWNYDPYWFDNYILLQRNALNNEQERIYPAGVRYFITGADTDEEDFNEDKIDCFVLTGYNKKLISENSYTAEQSKSYGLLFNLESEYWSDFNMRYALAAVVERGEFAGVPENLTPAYGIVPGASTALGRSYRELISDVSLTEFDKSKAAVLWNKALETRDIVSVENMRITVPDGFNGDLSIVTQQWQKAFGFFCGIEIVSKNEYALKLGEGRYEIALVEVSAEYNDPALLFKAVCPLEKNKNQRLVELLSSIESAERLSDAVALYRETESLILSDCGYVPLFYGLEYFIYKPELTDLIYYPFTEQIYFGFGKR